MNVAVKHQLHSVFIQIFAEQQAVDLRVLTACVQINHSLLSLRRLHFSFDFNSCRYTLRLPAVTWFSLPQFLTGK